MNDCFNTYLVSPELLQLLAEVQDAGGKAGGAGHQSLHLATSHLVVFNFLGCTL